MDDKYVLYWKERFGSHFIFSGYNLLFGHNLCTNISAWGGIRTTTYNKNCIFFDSYEDALKEKRNVEKYNKWKEHNDSIEIKKWSDVEEVDLLKYCQTLENNGRI